MAKLVRAIQPYCKEEIVAAMPCTRGEADSTGSDLFTRRAREVASGVRPAGNFDSLPEYVFLALGTHSLYAFDYRPKLFGYEIKMQVACWPRNEVSVVAECTATMAYFVITKSSGESYALEISAMSYPVGRSAVEFLSILGGSTRRTAR